MIKRDLLYYSTRAQADILKFSAGADNSSYVVGPAGTEVFTGSPLIAWTTAVFIGDTHEIWLRGNVWVCGSISASDVLTQSGDSVQEMLDSIQTKTSNNSSKCEDLQNNLDLVSSLLNNLISSGIGESEDYKLIFLEDDAMSSLKASTMQNGMLYMGLEEYEGATSMEFSEGFAVFDNSSFVSGFCVADDLELSSGFASF